MPYFVDFCKPENRSAAGLAANRKGEKRSMKKILIPVLVVLAFLVGTVGGLLWVRMDYLNYELDLVQYIGAAMENDSLFEKYGETVVRLDKNQAERLRSILSRTERRLELFYRSDGTGYLLTLTMDDRLTVTVEQPDPAQDTVYIIMRGDTVNRTYSISGYDTMHWLKSLLL